MPLISLQTIRDTVREESDLVNSLFVTDAELNGWIRRSYADLYAQVVQHFGDDYFVQTPNTGYQLTTDGINQLFPLPVGSGQQLMFKLLGVDVQVSGAPQQWISLKPFAFADRNRAAFPNSQIPQAGQVVRVLYVPYPTLPVMDADTIDGCNGWEEFIIIDVALKCAGKEETDPSLLMARREQMQARLDAEIENRNASEHGGKILDVTRRGYVGMQYRLNGNSLWLIGGPTPMTGYGYGLWDLDDSGSNFY